MVKKTGRGLEATIDFRQNLNSTNVKKFKIHFETKFTNSSNWSIFKLSNDSKSLFEICASKNKNYGYRVGTSGDRNDIVSADQTPIATDNNNFVTVDFEFNTETKLAKITVTDKDSNSASIEVSTGITDSITKLVIDGNGSSARDIAIKNLVITTSSSSSSDTLASAKAAAISELNSYYTTKYENESNNTIKESASSSWNSQKEALEATINNATSQSDVTSALTAAKQAVDGFFTSSAPESPKSFTLNPTDIEAGAYTAEKSIDNTPFTLVGAAGKQIDVTESRIALSKGSAKTTQNSIKIEATQAGLLTFKASSTKTSNKVLDSNDISTKTYADIEKLINNNFVVINASNSKIESVDYACTSTNGLGYEEFEYSIYLPEAGTYYFGGESSGIYIYSLTLDYNLTEANAKELTVDQAKTSYCDFIEAFKYTYLNALGHITDTNNLLEAKANEHKELINGQETKELAFAKYNEALKEMEKVIDSIKAEAELNTVKSSAKASIDEYVISQLEAANVESNEAVTSAVSSAKAAIDACKTADEVTSTIEEQNALIKAVIDNLKEEKVQEELNNAKSSAKASIDEYVISQLEEKSLTRETLEEAQESQLAAAISSAKASIDESISVETVNSNLETSKATLSELISGFVKTPEVSE